MKPSPHPQGDEALLPPLVDGELVEMPPETDSNNLVFLYLLTEFLKVVPLHSEGAIALSPLFFQLWLWQQHKF
jgi:hypothetical protein